MTVKAVIYDVDGTLVDSEPLHVSAWDETLKSYGYGLDELSHDFVRTMAGKKPIVIAAEMIAVLHIAATPLDFLDVKTQKYLDLMDRNLEAMDGAADSVIRLKESGYRLAIGTSLDRLLLDKILHKLDIQDDFEVIVTGDLIKKGKPDPETYFKVAEELNLKSGECCVIEDAQSGILSAKAAGTYCIAVENPDAIKQDTSEADVVISSLRQLTPELIESVAVSGAD